MTLLLKSLFFKAHKKTSSQTQAILLPAIYLTSFHDQIPITEGIEVCADAYIIKGNFDQSNLIATVQNLI